MEKNIKNDDIKRISGTLHTNKLYFCCTLLQFTFRSEHGYSRPALIISDRGICFDSSLTKKLSKSIRVKRAVRGSMI